MFERLASVYYNRKRSTLNVQLRKLYAPASASIMNPAGRLPQSGGIREQGGQFRISAMARRWGEGIGIDASGSVENQRWRGCPFRRRFCAKTLRVMRWLVNGKIAV